MAEVQRRQRVKLVLPEVLVDSLLTNRTKRDIYQGQLDALIGSGVDISSATAVGYLQSLTDAVIAATLDYNANMKSVLALARDKAGYNPETCSPIQDNVLETSGTVYWNGPVEEAA